MDEVTAHVDPRYPEQIHVTFPGEKFIRVLQQKHSGIFIPAPQGPIWTTDQTLIVGGYRFFPQTTIYAPMLGTVCLRWAIDGDEILVNPKTGQWGFEQQYWEAFDTPIYRLTTTTNGRHGPLGQPVRQIYWNLSSIPIDGQSIIRRRGFTSFRSWEKLSGHKWVECDDPRSIEGDMDVHATIGPPLSDVFSMEERVGEKQSLATFLRGNYGHYSDTAVDFHQARRNGQQPYN